MSIPDDPALGGELPHHAAAPARLVTSRFAVVTAATFCYFLAVGALVPTLPKYVEDELGGAPLLEGG